MTTFVSVGNATQPFHRLIAAVSRIASTLPQPVVVQHGNTPWPGVTGCNAKPFVEMGEFERLVMQAELLILHAGAGSVIHALRAGKIPVVMPRLEKYGEVVDDHQRELSHALAEAGKIIVAEEPDDLPRAVAEAMKRQKQNQPMVAESPMAVLVREKLRQYAEALNK